MIKEKLEILLSLPRNHYNAVIKLINPALTDEDLKPMFPQGWNDDKNWPQPKYNYDSFRHTQIQIDEWNEKMAGC